ncbi:uncharacterized protein A4U43_C06F19060 [Asparagus officinalis]|uniref:CNNM transmembrane domain-containing protein n=1 Tax=Asparagus officinalis TaxID=4686 RepID=A0A5P1ENU9_ASPOF|nr:uncharacterized protein A4U43_C06F19060 [Asparagus officinalis]
MTAFVLILVFAGDSEALAIVINSTSHSELRSLGKMIVLSLIAMPITKQLISVEDSSESNRDALIAPFPQGDEIGVLPRSEPQPMVMVEKLLNQTPRLPILMMGLQSYLSQ